MSANNQDKVQERKILSAEDILGSKDREIRYHKSAVWGGDVPYVPPSLEEKASARKMATMPTGKGGELEVDYEVLQATIILECAVKPDGGKMFSPSQLAALKKKNANAVKALANDILGND